MVCAESRPLAGTAPRTAPRAQIVVQPRCDQGVVLNLVVALLSDVVDGDSQLHLDGHGNKRACIPDLVDHRVDHPGEIDGLRALLQRVCQYADAPLLWKYACGRMSKRGVSFCGVRNERSQCNRTS